MKIKVFLLIKIKNRNTCHIVHFYGAVFGDINEEAKESEV